MSDFDEYADSYSAAVSKSIAFCGREVDFYSKRKAECLAWLTRRFVAPPATLSVVDVGCGVGTMDRFLTSDFAEVHGVDISTLAVERAAAENPDVQYRSCDTDELPYEDSSLDVAFAACVIHHVPVTQRHELLLEMHRVARPGGLVALFEHNPLNPLTRLAVSRCAFDDDAELLQRRTSVSLLGGAGLRPLESGYLLFFPWDKRPLATIERGLRRLPLGAQHYAAARAE